MKKKIVGILVIMLLISATLTSVAVTANIENINNESHQESTDVDWWPSFQHDNQNTGISSSSTPTSFLTWELNISAGFWGSPIIYENTIFIGDLSNNFYSINLDDGSENWMINLGSAIRCAPVADNGYVYVATFDKDLICLDAETGTEQWNVSDGVGNILSSPKIDNGMIYIGSRDELLCIDATSGVEQWSFPAASPIFSSPVIYNDKVFYASAGVVFCLDIQTGSKQWNQPIGSLIYGSPCIGNNQLFIGADNDIFCMNPQDGSILWQYTTGGSVMGTPLFAYGNIYFGSSDHVVYCVNVTTQDELWSYSTNDEITSSPVLCDGTVIVSSKRDHIYWMNALTGEIIDQYEIDLDPSFSSPAIADGKLVFTAFETPSSGKILCFGNYAPDIPDQPAGPTEGLIGVEYTYTTNEVTDPDGDEVEYGWDFNGDEVVDDWTTQPTASNSWNEPGLYEVKVKAKDINNAESDWSDVLEVTIIEQFPELSIESITGGLGVTTIISNIGDADATNVNYALTVTGGILNLINVTVTDTQTDLAVDEGIVVETGIFIGLGPIEINVTVVCDEGSSDEETADGMQLIFFSVVN